MLSLLNKEIGKLCFYLSMNFIHLGDASCKEAQTAILNFHNLLEKSHKRCIFRNKCAICPVYYVQCNILVYSGTKMFGLSCCFVGPFVHPCHSTVHLHDCLCISALFNFSFREQGCLYDRTETVILFISFGRGRFQSRVEVQHESLMLFC